MTNNRKDSVRQIKDSLEHFYSLTARFAERGPCLWSTLEVNRAIVKPLWLVVHVILLIRHLLKKYLTKIKSIRLILHVCGLKILKILTEKAIELMLDPHPSNFWLLLQLIKPKAQIHHCSGGTGGFNNGEPAFRWIHACKETWCVV